MKELLEKILLYLETNGDFENNKLPKCLYYEGVCSTLCEVLANMLCGQIINHNEYDKLLEYININQPKTEFKNGYLAYDLSLRYNWLEEQINL